MSGTRCKPEEIVRHLREADVPLSQGTTVAEVVRRLSVNKITYYRWRREFGGMKTDQAKKLKDMELENLRRSVARQRDLEVGSFISGGAASIARSAPSRRPLGSSRTRRLVWRPTFLAHALDEAREGVAFLLRTARLESEERPSSRKPRRRRSRNSLSACRWSKVDGIPTRRRAASRKG